MKRVSMGGRTGFVVEALRNLARRRGWFVENLSPAKLLNLSVASAQFALKREVMKAWPIVVKVDLSPLCNLHCTVCVHARPSDGSSPALKAQVFNGSQKMGVGQFRRIVEEISGRCLAVSMYYLGDPFVHPDLDSMCRLAWDAGLNSHVSTNFSFALSDDRITRIVTSGLTHLTVCVDGLSQEKYQRTRVGGRVDLVLDNLERLLRCRRALGRRYPKVEVQYIKFQHNVDELGEATRRFRSMGVDQITDYWGYLHNYTDLGPAREEAAEPADNRMLPQCYWPHFSMLIKYNGDVIPCCHHRLDTQHTESGDPRAVGNVFRTSLWEVWNSPAYRELRRLVSNPERVRTEADLARTFCAGCPRVFVTDVGRHLRSGADHRWEDLYRYDDARRVVRIPVGRGAGSNREGVLAPGGLPGDGPGLRAGNRGAWS